MSTGFASFISRWRAVVAYVADEPAVVSRGENTVSYGELWRRAAAITGELARNGVGREDIVGLHLEKSVDYLASLIGTWLAGAAPKFVRLTNPAVHAARPPSIF